MVFAQGATKYSSSVFATVVVILGTVAVTGDALAAVLTDPYALTGALVSMPE